MKTPALVIAGLLLLAGSSAFGQVTNLVSTTAPVLPQVGFSILRLLGSLGLVVGLFLAGVWCFKNWQRLTVQRGRNPKLQILEVKSLGGRHAIYLVAYEQQRLLLASSPGNVNLITHLPEATALATTPILAPRAFAETLDRVASPEQH